MGTPLLIGRDPCGRAVSIHMTVNDDGQILYAGHIHNGDGSREWGQLATRVGAFDSLQGFPTMQDIWAAINYNYEIHAQRARIHSAAIYHTIEMRIP
jgi:hypothetical protein